jgi:hypothetical protein
MLQPANSPQGMGEQLAGTQIDYKRAILTKTQGGKLGALRACWIRVGRSAEGCKVECACQSWVIIHLVVYKVK